MSYDVIVVGAGIFGSCTAYHCQKRGLRTLLIEKFNTGHLNGSSHGKSRIIRYAHVDPEYIPVVRDSYEQIEELETQTGTKLWQKTSLLWATSNEEARRISAALKKHGCNHEVLEGEQINKRFPQFKFTNDYSAIVDPNGGMLFADKWLSTFQNEFVKLGGTIRQNEPVVSFKDDSMPEIETAKGTYSASKIIFTVGVWIKQLFPDLPLKIQPESISVCYWKPLNPRFASQLKPEKFPVFIGSDLSDPEPSLPWYYALPEMDYSGSIKLCYHSGLPIPSLEHPKTHDKRFTEGPAKYIKDHLPIINPTPAFVDQCKYTISEDHHYVVGPAPGFRNILVGGCGSGSGFKVAPGIGRALSEMAAGQKTTVDFSFFSFDRFMKKSHL
ncbi:hypothetical protein WR25_08828 [Diploscapter pachys]|uniref:sarcosine oxidasee (formaldehyde-forming) n=1 Tax=Diploscapter pachys TaxID=2018661 RepID=A0A2A2JAK6_9BILA|nr:hypothetical protein WR25_08828 [Diploscapter pachys]